MCATSGLPSTPSYLLHNTTRVVARTLLHSTLASRVILVDGLMNYGGGGGGVKLGGRNQGAMVHDVQEIDHSREQDSVGMDS